MKKKICTLFTIMLLALITVGCSATKEDNKDTHNKIGIRGIVTEKSVTGGIDGILANISVEGSLFEDTMYDKASVNITKDTLIQKDDMSRLFEISDITEGTMVEIVFKGAIAESYPVQGTADIIRIITVNALDLQN